MVTKEVLSLIDKDFPRTGPITAEYLNTEENRHVIGSVRIATSRIWVDQEYENYRRKILNTDLP